MNRSRNGKGLNCGSCDGLGRGGGFRGRGKNQGTGRGLGRARFNANAKTFFVPQAFIDEGVEEGYVVQVSNG